MSDKPLKGIAAKLQKKTANFSERVESSARPSIADQPPITMPGQLGAFRLEAQKYQDQIATLKQQLADAQAAGGGNTAALQAELDAARRKQAQIEARLADAEAELLNRPAAGEAPSIALDLLDAVPGRKRALTPEEYRALYDNILQHGVIEPIKIRAKPDGRYDIVSGHNRTQACRELGMLTIAYTLDMGDEDETDERAFFSNLFHPDLPDVEKYLGLQRLMQAKPELDTPAALAAYVGLPDSTVRLLLKFGELPAHVIELLQKAPKALGAKAAADLAALTKGNEERVCDAVATLIGSGGKITQQQAVELARPPAPKPVQRDKPAPVTIKSGKSNYCSMVAASKVLRIAFASEDEVAAVQELVREVLERRARELKK